MRREKDREIEVLAGGLRPPGPPPGLRARVLGRARDEWREVSARGFWTRTWESRPARLAWGCSILLLALAHGLLFLRDGKRRSVTAETASRARPASPVQIERLPRVDEQARPLVAGELFAKVEGREARGDFREPRKDGRS